MKKALMYGAGNIGRGFIGALIRGAGYSVAFVDVDEGLVNSLNEKGQYTLREIATNGHTDHVIDKVSAVNGRDEAGVIRAISECDLMATAVGARVLPHIAPLVAKGIQARFLNNKPPLNIIICENLMDAHLYLEGLLKQELNPDEQARFDKDIGLVEASIGRMVPIQTAEMKEGDPLRVCVEGYSFLPVDRDAFKGGIPALHNLVPYSPFDFYIKRKLFLHNMGHATTAYLGQYASHDMIAAAIREPWIQLLVSNAMTESLAALSLAYDVPIGELLSHRDDLLYRFHNTALKDSCARVGADVPRKLARQDRLVGALLLCRERGIQPVFIALGATAALYQHIQEQGLMDTPVQVFTALSGLRADDELTELLLRFYSLFEKRASLHELYHAAMEEKHRRNGPVV